MYKTALLWLAAAAVCVMPVSSQTPQRRNVILFVGDGAGVSSLNAASILGYDQARALYLQKAPQGEVV